MSIFNYLIRHIEGLIGTPAAIQNKQLKIDVGDNGSGRDRSQCIYKDNAGIEHIFGTTEELKDYTDTQITNNLGSATTDGTYTPSPAIVANCTGISASVFTWYRVGDVVHMFGSVYLTVTSAQSNTIFDLDLPVASNLASAFDAAGSVGDINLTNSTLNFGISVEPTNDLVRVSFYPNSNGVMELDVNVSYRVK